MLFVALCTIIRIFSSGKQVFVKIQLSLLKVAEEKERRFSVANEKNNTRGYTGDV